MFDNINNTKSSNLKNNNFKYILFALLLNFVIFFLIFMQESFLLIFDDITNFFIVHHLDLGRFTDTLFGEGIIQNFIEKKTTLFYNNLDTYLGSEHYIKQSTLRAISDSFKKNNVAPNFEFTKLN
jgi:hypothetical protein